MFPGLWKTCITPEQSAYSSWSAATALLCEQQAFLAVQNKDRLRKDLREKSQMLTENDKHGAQSHPIPPEGDGSKDGLKIAEDDTLEKAAAAAVHAWVICSLLFFLP